MKFGNKRLPDRFWSKVVQKRNGRWLCWEWQAGKNGEGYGSIKINGKMESAHRVAFEASNGPLAVDLKCHHLCNNKACVRPSHLEGVTPLAHSARHEHDRPTYSNGRRTHCPVGHEISKVGTYANSGGGLRCRKCMRIAQARFREKQKSMRADSFAYLG